MGIGLFPRMTELFLKQNVPNNLKIQYRFTEVRRCVALQPVTDHLRQSNYILFQGRNVQIDVGNFDRRR